MDPIKLSMRFRGILLHTSEMPSSGLKESMEAIVSLQCARRLCSRHVLPNLSQVSMLVIPYSVMLPFKANSLHLKLYEVQHYYTLKEINRKFLSRSTLHDILVPCLHNSRPQKFHSEICAGPVCLFYSIP